MLWRQWQRPPSGGKRAPTGVAARGRPAASPAPGGGAACAADLPAPSVELILLRLDQESRLAAAATCRHGRAVSRASADAHAAVDARHAGSSEERLLSLGDWLRPRAVRRLARALGARALGAGRRGLPGHASLAWLDALERCRLGEMPLELDADLALRELPSSWRPAAGARRHAKCILDIRGSGILMSATGFEPMGRMRV